MAKPWLRRRTESRSRTTGNLQYRRHAHVGGNLDVMSFAELSHDAAAHNFIVSNVKASSSLMLTDTGYVSDKN